MELLDIYTADGKRSGRTVDRAEWTPAGDGYVKIVHVFVMGPDGRVLIQQRALTKKVWPGQWTILGGFAVSGEEPEDAVIRETAEEYGLDISRCPRRRLFTLLRQGRGCIMEFWMAAVDCGLDSVVRQEEEVAAVRFATPEELLGIYSDEERWRSEPGRYRQTVLDIIAGVPRAFAELTGAQDRP